MELALQEYLRRGVVGKHSKNGAIQYIANVQFLWCCLMSTFTEDCAQELLKLLVVLLFTIRGCCLYMEEYKMSKEKTTKGNKSLRKELKQFETTKESNKGANDYTSHESILDVIHTC